MHAGRGQPQHRLHVGILLAGQRLLQQRQLRCVAPFAEHLGRSQPGRTVGREQLHRRVGGFDRHPHAVVDHHLVHAVRVVGKHFAGKRVEHILAVEDQHAVAGHHQALVGQGIEHPAGVVVADLAEVGNGLELGAEVVVDEALQHGRVEGGAGMAGHGQQHEHQGQEKASHGISGQDGGTNPHR